MRNESNDIIELIVYINIDGIKKYCDEKHGKQGPLFYTKKILGICVHEASHACDYLFEHIGANHDMDTEIRAYITQHLFTEIIYTVNTEITL